MKTLWRIEAPHYVAAVIVEEGRVVEAADILWWTRGKLWAEVKAYFKRKGYRGTPMEVDDGRAVSTEDV